MKTASQASMALHVAFDKLTAFWPLTSGIEASEHWKSNRKKTLIIEKQPWNCAWVTPAPMSEHGLWAAGGGEAVGEAVTGVGAGHRPVTLPLMQSQPTADAFVTW